MVRRLGLVVPPIVLVVAGILLLGESPPSSLFEEARQRLEAARSARATDYAPSQFADAEAAWETALSAWRLENDRPAAFRSFDSVTASLGRAELAAETALRRSNETADSLRKATERNLAEVRTLRPPLEQAASFFPSGFVDRRALLQGHTHASMAESALRRDDLWKAAHAAERALVVYDSLTRAALVRIQPLITDVGEWRRRRDTLLRNRTKPVIVVDKAARQLYLYQRDRVDSFRVELGRRWLGDKLMEGDRATPEGLYHVVRKLDRGQSRYHRALLLDYPNEEDRRRFANGRASGAIPQGARIGGNIEVHGGGGRDVDWTDGCVALTDREIESIFDRVPVGTPILIAGALSARLPLFNTQSNGTNR